MFESYLNLIADFSEQITSNFTVWIDGSFVTKKVNPNDIDLVIFLEASVFQEKEVELKSLELKYKAEDMDLYFVKIYPENHKKYTLYKLDKADWNFLFTKTKRHARTRKSFSKGFLSIKYHEKEQTT